MSPASTSVAKAWRALASLSLVSLVLASCGTGPTPAARPISGIPSLSISVPLSSVACTTANVCLALGTSGTDSGPSSIGEDRHASGGWRLINVPNAPSSLLTASSCWSDGCLVGGSQPSGDLLWRYSATANTVLPVLAPVDGSSISAIACSANEACALIDQIGVLGIPRLTLTTNAGATWGVSLPLTWSKGKSITSLACLDSLECLAAASSRAQPALVEVTQDAGVTWSPVVTPPSWMTISALSCRELRCEALITTSDGSIVAGTKNFATSWTSTKISAQINSLACASNTHCVLAGQSASRSPWLATLSKHTLTKSTLDYVPSPLLKVACGASICAAIGVSTVVALRP